MFSHTKSNGFYRGVPWGGSVGVPGGSAGVPWVFVDVLGRGANV